MINFEYSCSYGLDSGNNLNVSRQGTKNGDMQRYESSLSFSSHMFISRLHCLSTGQRIVFAQSKCRKGMESLSMWMEEGAHDRKTYWYILTQHDNEFQIFGISLRKMITWKANTSTNTTTLLRYLRWRIFVVVSPTHGALALAFGMLIFSFSLSHMWKYEKTLSTRECIC